MIEVQTLLANEDGRPTGLAVSLGWVCWCCRQMRPKSDFKSTTAKAIQRRTCTPCKKLQQYNRRKKHYLANKDKIHAREHARSLVRGWGRAYKRRQSALLTDNHIKDVLTARTRIPREWITPEMIAAKRLQLQLRRELNEKRKTTTE